VSVSLTGKDTHLINGRVLADFGDGDIGNIDFPNNLVEGKVGKNGNVIYALNSTGKTCTYTIRVLLGSDDDKFFNSEMNRYLQDPASYTLMDGEFIKRVGDGQGNVNNVIYILDGGIIQKMPNVKENVEGDTEQTLSVWQIMFANTDRAIA